MTRDQILEALELRKPFTILMADGRAYAVPHRDYIFAPPGATWVGVFTQRKVCTFLPFRTMTGLRMTGDGSELPAA